MKLQVFDFLLRLYPKDHRHLFGVEMASVLRQALEDRRAQGRGAYLWFAIWEMAGLVAGAAALWAAKLANRRDMEPAPETPLSPSDNVQETEQLIQRCIHCMTHAIANHEFEKARFYSTAERRLRQRLEDLTQ